MNIPGVGLGVSVARIYSLHNGKGAGVDNGEGNRALRHEEDNIFFSLTI